MEYKSPLSLRADINHLVGDGDVTESQTQKLPRCLVVIASNKHDLCSLECFSQNLLHDIVLQLMPVPAALERPAVDDVPYLV